MFVVRITGSPFIPSDILNAGTAFNSVKNQNIFSGVLLIGLFFIVLEILFIYVICRVYGDSEICLAKWNRIVQSFIYGLCIVMMISYVGSLDLLNFKGNLAYGYVLYFINCFGDFSIDEPEGYYKVDIDTSSGIDSVDSVEVSESNPNVVIVMSEAFSDLASVYDLEFNEDPIPYFHSLQSEYLNGTVYSSVLGNNTVSSEFECLTGISTGFSAKGSDVYQNFWKGRKDIFTIGNLFEDKGYSSVFIHPCVGENYNRSNIYSQLGYEDTVFLEDFDEDVDKLRTFVTDEVVFSEILNTLQDTDESTFLMSITMQNHGRYNDEFEIDPRIELRNMQGEYEDVENYLSLLKKSDGALKDFLNSLNDLKEPTVVLFFGDHQPMVDYSFYSECVGVDYNSMGVSDKESLYKIPYLLWSNYNISSDYEVPEITSMNYLSLILNNYLGNTNSEWLNLLKDVQKYYPVITENFVINSDGDILGIDDIKQFILSDDSESSEILRKYWYACYSFIAGNK